MYMCVCIYSKCNSRQCKAINCLNKFVLNETLQIYTLMTPLFIHQHHSVPSDKFKLVFD